MGTKDVKKIKKTIVITAREVCGAKKNDGECKRKDSEEYSEKFVVVINSNKRNFCKDIWLLKLGILKKIHEDTK